MNEEEEEEEENNIIKKRVFGPSESICIKDSLLDRSWNIIGKI